MAQSTTLPTPKKSFADLIEGLFSTVERRLSDLHPYQNAAVDFLMSNPFSALFIDLGMGKTCISLTVIYNLLCNFTFKRALIIAPRRVAFNTWPNEIAIWDHTCCIGHSIIRDEVVSDVVNAAGQKRRSDLLYEFASGLDDGLLTRDEIKAEIAEYKKSEFVKAEVTQARLEASRKAVREHFKRSPQSIHIINREQVEFLVDAWGRDWPYDVVIIDESSSFKDHRTDRFKALSRVRPLIKRLHELTATPAAETYLHLFSQIYLLDLGARFGRSFTNYQERYFTQNPYTRKWKLRPGAREEIAQKIADITLTMKAEDYLKLEKPKMLFERLDIEDHLQLYREMERNFIVKLPDGSEVAADTAAALSQKLLQMASGVLYETRLQDKGDGNFEKKRVVHGLHDIKIERLRELIEQVEGEPILVAYWHDSSRTRLQKAFPNAVVMDPDAKCERDWTAKKIPILLVHPASAGHGLNLQYGGRRLVFFDIPWSLEFYLQTIGRLARQGQKLVVFVHHLIASGTIDEDVVESLQLKEDEQERLFRLLKKYGWKIKGRKVVRA